ncbi:mercury methylation corrinoid protein HgcA [Pelotomaculum propionicicum]|uniref:mercury methylation corrinoid protein HgcA n=1 Tax=Pelotomaculum propionicicum TaxID=258475 RepID=UPI003B79466D
MVLPEKKIECGCRPDACCGGYSSASEDDNFIDESGAGWVTGRKKTPAGDIPRVSTSLTSEDIIGSWKARWGTNRHNYKIKPGVYCVGEPTDRSPVLVTANYKLTFDALRKELADLDAWIMVLDTKGINVWCAAGKGTFGTGEIIRRIETTGLARIVSHRTLVLPQLGAPGVAAHEVLKKSGFRVVYGPVRAADIKEFISAGMKATKNMRSVEFTFADRITLIPIELVQVILPFAILVAVLAALNLAGIRLLSSPGGIIPYLGAVLAGCVVTPALLPWIPGRAFALKGWLTGFLWALIVDAYCFWSAPPSFSVSLGLFFLFCLPAISSYLALNFTGASTYTSLSGVKKEIKTWLPVLIGSAGTGAAMIIIGLFFKF